MSEAIQPEQPPYLGEAWTEIVSRPALEEFSRAFASDVAVEASVVSRPIVGPIGLWAFFQATRAMYERDRFHSRNRHEGENVPGEGRGLRRQASGRRHHYCTGRPRGDHERITISSPLRSGCSLCREDFAASRLKPGRNVLG